MESLNTVPSVHVPDRALTLMLILLISSIMKTWNAGKTTLEIYGSDSLIEKLKAI